MSKIVKIDTGCVVKKVMYVLPGTTEEEIRVELIENGEDVEDDDILVKSPLEPKYHKGYDLWKLYEASDATKENIEDEDYWDIAEAKLSD